MSYIYIKFDSKRKEINMPTSKLWNYWMIQK